MLLNEWLSRSSKSRKLNDQIPQAGTANPESSAANPGCSDQPCRSLASWRSISRSVSVATVLVDQSAADSLLGSVVLTPACDSIASATSRKIIPCAYRSYSTVATDGVAVVLCQSVGADGSKELMETECMSKVEIAYLKALRKHGFDPDAPIPGVEIILDKLRAAGAPEDIVEELIEQQPKTLKEQYDLVLKPIQHDVMADAALLQASWKGDILVGGVPTNACNASAQKVDGGYLILVNHGMLQLLHQLAKVFISSAHLVMVACGDEEVPMALADRLAFIPSDWTKEDALEAVTKIYRCLRAGDITAAPAYPVFAMQQEMDFYDGLLRYAERFVVSHELAHVLSGDCEAEERATDPLEFQSKRQTDLNADTLAVRLVFASVDFSKDDPEILRDAQLRAAGISLVFLSNWITECCQNLPKGLSGEDDEMETHPHLQRRLLKARSNIRKWYGPITDFMDIFTTWAWGVVLPVVADLTDNSDLRKMASDPPAIRFD